MRLLVLLLATAAIAETAGAQTATAPAPWTTLDAPPCEALTAFRSVDARGRVLFAGEERERGEHYATFDAADLAFASQDAPLVWVDYTESGELFGTSLYVRPAGLVSPTADGTWEADALALAGGIVRAVALCFGEDVSGQEPSVHTDSEGVRTVSQWATGDTQVFVRAVADGQGGLHATPEVVVGLEW